MYLFLSPHYDDAVYSCGGTMHRLRQQNQDVGIFTIMAKIPQPPYPDTPIINDVHQRWQAGDHPVVIRREEDKKAATLLGTIPFYGDLADCIYRTHQGEALYPSEESLFGDIHPNDTAIYEMTLPLDVEQITTLYAPLAIGHHVDHQLVRAWTLHLKVQHPQLDIRFYADYPYSRDEKALIAALQSFPGSCFSEDTVFSEKHMSAKVAAMIAYRSQISTFWKDDAELAEDVRAAFSEMSDPVRYIEKAWRIRA